jgi:hypothetical protein
VTKPEKTADGWYHFHSSMGSAVLQLLATTVGGVAFAGLALAVLTGVVAVDQAEIRPALAIMLGFFALLLLAAAPQSARRLSRRTVLSVGPEGLRLPELGLLPWRHVADVRLESYGAPGREGEGISRQWRLGIVPTVDAPVGRRSPPLAWRLANRYYRVIGSVAGHAGLGLDHLAPVGIDASELDISLQEVLDCIEELRPATSSNGRDRGVVGA